MKSIASTEEVRKYNRDKSKRYRARLKKTNPTGYAAALEKNRMLLKSNRLKWPSLSSAHRAKYEQSARLRNPEKFKKMAALRMKRWRQRIKKEKPWLYERLRQRDKNRQRSSVWCLLKMTSEKFESHLRLQGGKCGICKADNNGKRKRMFLDHDHKTLKFRGLLCSKCNSGLGFFGDDIMILRSAIAYLEAALRVSP